MTSRVVPNSRDMIAEARQAQIVRDDAVRAAQSAMLATLERIVQHGYGLKEEAQAEPAIAAAKAAGIKG